MDHEVSMARMNKPRFQMGHVPRGARAYVIPVLGAFGLLTALFGIGILSQHASIRDWKDYLGAVFLITSSISIALFLSARLAIFDDRISMCFFAIGGRRFLETDIPLSALTNVYIYFDSLGTYGIAFEFSEKCRGFAKSYGKRQLHGFLTELSLLVDESVIEEETKRWKAEHDRKYGEGRIQPRLRR